MTSTEEKTADPARDLARRLGQILSGFAVGLMVVVAGIEIYGQIGNLSAFQYQGY